MKIREEMNQAAFGRRLFALRREQQITSERLSEMCGVNPSFIRSIENAARLPSLPVFVMICNQLHVAPNFFLIDSIAWNEEDKIAALEAKLRTLSPCHFDVVIETVNTMIDNNFTNIGEVSCRQTRNYLVIIVRGLARNLQKKRGEHLELPIEDFEWSDFLSMDDPQLEQIEYEALRQAIAKLPAIHRDILYAIYFEGCSVKEIAKHIGLSEKAAQKRLERARQVLQQVLKKGGWEA